MIKLVKLKKMMKYIIRMRYRGDGASTMWSWGVEFNTLEEAVSYRNKYNGKPEIVCGWIAEVEIFHLEKIVPSIEIST
jgi:hypothetical protein